MMGEEEGPADMLNVSATNWTYCSCAHQCRTGELSSTNISCDCLWDIHPSLLKYSPYLATIEAVFFMVAFFWNLFIIISFAMHRKLLKDPASIYLFNLAVTDFLLAIFVVFQCFVAELTGGFVIGHTDIIRCRLCEFLGFMIMFLMANTLHTLAILSFDRFFLLVNPMSYQSYFNWRRALVLVTVVWCLSLCIAIPPIFGFGEYAFTITIANCHPQWQGSSYRGIKNLHYIVFVGTEALIPIAFLTFTNLWTYKIVNSVLRARLKRNHSFTKSTSAPQMQKMKNERVDHTRQQLQLIKVFGALFLAHTACWAPVLIVLLVANIIGPTNIPLEVYLAGWVLYLTNPVAHPILETFFIKDLRTRVKRAKRSVKKSIKHVGSFSTGWVQRSLSRMSSLRSKKSECGSPQMKSPDGLAFQHRDERTLQPTVRITFTVLEHPATNGGMHLHNASAPLHQSSHAVKKNVLARSYSENDATDRGRQHGAETAFYTGQRSHHETLATVTEGVVSY